MTVVVWPSSRVNGPSTSQPSNAWMVGDNLEWDVTAPMRLGMTGIWLDRLGRGLPDSTPLKPHRIIFSLT